MIQSRYISQTQIGYSILIVSNLYPFMCSKKGEGELDYNNFNVFNAHVREVNYEFDL